jgi:uncharacterized protein with GYD domain
MATYISLINWTEQGVRNYRESTRRADAAAQEAQRLGGQLQQCYWTIGPYDLVLVAEFADDDTATAFALSVSSLGNVRTTTMRAYDAEQMNQIIGKIG